MWTTKLLAWTTTEQHISLDMCQINVVANFVSFILISNYQTPVLHKLACFSFFLHCFPRLPSPSLCRPLHPCWSGDTFSLRQLLLKVQRLAGPKSEMQNTINWKRTFSKASRDASSGLCKNEGCIWRAEGLSKWSCHGTLIVMLVICLTCDKMPAQRNLMD